MRKKYLCSLMAVLLAAGGLWLAWVSWRVDDTRAAGAEGGLSPQTRGSENGQVLEAPARLAPPDPNRKFRNLTPEERVKLARQGPIGG